MNTTTVSTKDELELAINNKVSKIICTGDIAEKVNKSYNIKTLSTFMLPILVASIAAIPFTAGLSTIALAPIAATTGLEAVIILAIIFLGYTLVKQIIETYNKVSAKINPQTGEFEVVLEKK